MSITASVTNTPLPKNIFVPAEDIDFKLDDRGVIDGQASWEWTSCGLTFGDAYRSDSTFTSQAAAANDAVTFLTRAYSEQVERSSSAQHPIGIDIDLPETSPYQNGVHFELCAYAGRKGIYWQGLEVSEQSHLQSHLQSHMGGTLDFSKHGSDSGYSNERCAAAAAIYCFHRLRHYNSVNAISLCRELALPVHPIFEEHFVSLTVSQASGYGAHDGDVEAMSLEAKEDIVIDQAEADAFMGECHGWQDVAMTYEDGTTFTNAQRFQSGYGVVVQIDQDDWAKRLAAL